MTSPAPAKPYLAPVISIPVFDDHRILLVDWFERVERGDVRKVIGSVAVTHQQLQRVRNSARHARLAEFLEQSLLTLRAGELEAAKYILLTALAAFGWPAELAG